MRGRITQAVAFRLMRGLWRAVLEQAGLKFPADEADEIAYLFGREPLFKAGHAVASIPFTPLQILRLSLNREP